MIKLKTLFKLVLVAGLAGGLAFSAGAQTINPSPFFTSFADTMMASGLLRVAEAARAIWRGDAGSAAAHATAGPLLQQNLVCVLEGGA